MIVANAISAVHCTLNTALGLHLQLADREDRTGRAAPGPGDDEHQQPGQADPDARAARGHLVVPDGGQHQAEPAAQEQVDGQRGSTVTASAAQ